eukprot:1138376-Pelagomonas_calceolata.AAC.4
MELKVSPFSRHSTALTREEESEGCALGPGYPSRSRLFRSEAAWVAAGVRDTREFSAPVEIQLRAPAAGVLHTLWTTHLLAWRAVVAVFDAAAGAAVAAAARLGERARAPLKATCMPLGCHHPVTKGCPLPTLLSGIWIAGIYEEVNANVLVVADYKAFNKDRVEQLVEIVNVKVRPIQGPVRKPSQDLKMTHTFVAAMFPGSPPTRCRMVILSDKLTPACVSVQVEGPHSGVLYEKKDVSEGQFAFTAKIGGEYKACFSVRGVMAWLFKHFHRCIGTCAATRCHLPKRGFDA